MDILIIGLWIFLSLAIPVALIFCAGNSYGGTENWKIVGKLLLSFAAYILTCIIILLVFIFIVFTPHPNSGREMTAAQQIIALSIIYSYGLIGYLLCSFVNGNFFKPWKISLFGSKKSQSIFNPK